MPEGYASSLGARLRAIRTQKGLSLQAVEAKSDGKWKAVVVGSYERGDRAITAQRLFELAQFYGVPVSMLIGEQSRPTTTNVPGRVTIDLEQLHLLDSEELKPLKRFTANIAQQRGDFNGRMLSIRAEDVRALAIIYDVTPAQMVENLKKQKILVGSDD